MWLIELSLSYGITTADRPTIKKIAGKIVPAISTTTAFVTGAIAVELFKITAGLKTVERYRSCFANLSMPMFCFTEPGACKKYSYGGHEWSEWDHIVFDKTKGTSFKDLDMFLQREYHVMLDSVLIGSKYLYNQFVGLGENQVMISQICRNVSRHRLWMP